MTTIYLNTAIKAGSKLNGVNLISDDNLIIAVAAGVSIRKLRSTLTPQDEEDVLTAVKEFHIEKSIDASFLEAREAGFEYPTSSGNFFNISDPRDYHSLILFKDSFSYPMDYAGVGLASVVFSNSSDVTAFVSAALTAHQVEYQGPYSAAVVDIKSITILGSGTLEQAIMDVLSISY